MASVASAVAHSSRPSSVRVMTPTTATAAPPTTAAPQTTVKATPQSARRQQQIQVPAAEVTVSTKLRSVAYIRATSFDAALLCAGGHDGKLYMYDVVESEADDGSKQVLLSARLTDRASVTGTSEVIKCSRAMADNRVKLLIGSAAGVCVKHVPERSPATVLEGFGGIVCEWAAADRDIVYGINTKQRAVVQRDLREAPSAAATELTHLLEGETVREITASFVDPNYVAVMTARQAGQDGNQRLLLLDVRKQRCVGPAALVGACPASSRPSLIDLGVVDSHILKNTGHAMQMRSAANAWLDAAPAAEDVLAVTERAGVTISNISLYTLRGGRLHAPCPRTGRLPVVTANTYKVVRWRPYFDSYVAALSNRIESELSIWSTAAGPTPVATARPSRVVNGAPESIYDFAWLGPSHIATCSDAGSLRVWSVAKDMIATSAYLGQGITHRHPPTAASPNTNAHDRVFSSRSIEPGSASSAHVRPLNPTAPEGNGGKAAGMSITTGEENAPTNGSRTPSSAPLSARIGGCQRDVVDGTRFLAFTSAGIMTAFPTAPAGGEETADAPRRDPSPKSAVRVVPAMSVEALVSAARSQAALYVVPLRDDRTMLVAPATSPPVTPFPTATSTFPAMPPSPSPAQSNTTAAKDATPSPPSSMAAAKKPIPAPTTGPMSAFRRMFSANKARSNSTTIPPSAARTPTGAGPATPPSLAGPLSGYRTPPAAHPCDTTAVVEAEPPTNPEPNLIRPVCDDVLAAHVRSFEQANCATATMVAMPSRLAAPPRRFTALVKLLRGLCGGLPLDHVLVSTLTDVLSDKDRKKTLRECADLLLPIVAAQVQNSPPPAPVATDEHSKGQSSTYEWAAQRRQRNADTANAVWRSIQQLLGLIAATEARGQRDDETDAMASTRSLARQLAGSKHSLGLTAASDVNGRSHLSRLSLPEQLVAVLGDHVLRSLDVLSDVGDAPSCFALFACVLLWNGLIQTTPAQQRATTARSGHLSAPEAALRLPALEADPSWVERATEWLSATQTALQARDLIVDVHELRLICFYLWDKNDVHGDLRKSVLTDEITVRCVKCKKSLQHMERFDRPTEADPSPNALRIRAAPPRCGCADTETNLSHLNTARSSGHICAICERPVDGTFVQFPGRCKHGAHPHHLRQWIAVMSRAPSKEAAAAAATATAGDGTATPAPLRDVNCPLCLKLILPATCHNKALKK